MIRRTIHPLVCHCLGLLPAFLFSAVLFLPCLIHAGETKRTPVWKINGTLSAFEDPNHVVKALALDMLSELKALHRIKDQVPMIGAVLLGDPNPSVRSAAAKALGEMGDAAKDHLPKIVALLNDPNPSVRSAAAKALGEMGEVAKDQTTKIAALLDDTDLFVRIAAAKVLGGMGEAAKDHLPKIVALLVTSSVTSHIAFAEALGKMGEVAKDQIPKIIALLDDPEPYIRAGAIEALGTMKMTAKGQIPKIVALLDDSNWIVRSAAAKVLGEMGETAKDQIPKIVALLDDPQTSIRVAAAKALGEMGETAKDQIPKIVSLLDDPQTFIRVGAIKALGTMGTTAKDQIPKITALLDDQNWEIRSAAVKALGKMGEAAKDQLPKMLSLFHDPEYFVRRAVAEMLWEIEEVAQDQLPRILSLLDDSSYFVRINAAWTMAKVGDVREEQFPKIVPLLNNSILDIPMIATLSMVKIGPVDTKTILHLLNPTYGAASRASRYRFLAHFFGGGASDPELLTQWLGRSNYFHSIHIAYDEGIQILNVFKNAWTESWPLTELRTDLATKIALVIERTNWKPGDLPLLQEHWLNLSTERIPEASHAAASVQNVISSLERRNRVFSIGGMWLVHGVFWLLLVFVYPKSRIIQAIFFWNPWVRRIVGLGYIGFALNWIPFLREKLFSPFKASLLSDATLEYLGPQAYFDASEVKSRPAGTIKPITEVIPGIQGQIILEGESGLGKTMFLRHLVNHSKRILVFLPAKKCAKGVIEAIQAKLHGPAKDPRFLRNLIYCGAIDICIDGLNEVTADTRAKITEFVESYFKGNIIMATQPLEWVPPATAKTYIIQPFTHEKIACFLLTRQAHLPDDAKRSGADYERACSNYLAEALNENQEKEVLASAKRILSNPMDLTVVAQLLATGLKPDLFHLLEQQYNIMSEDYTCVNIHQKFPLRPFSETVYRMKLNDESALPKKEYIKELSCMARHKMVVIRQSLDSEGNPTKAWHFRHDKIMEFFVVQTFLGTDNERPAQHMDDPRFRGVYFLLAMLMPLEDAQALRERLIQYAADTKDHTLSDSFIRLLRSRKAD